MTIEKNTENKEKYSPINMSAYDYLRHKSKNYESLIALSFYGIKWTYSYLFEKIEETERALRSHGIKKGDVVLVSLPAIPEAVYLFYAVNKIGAIYCGLDCRSTAEEIAKTMRDVNPKICFVSDFHLWEFKEISTVTIVCIRSTNSIGGFTKFTAFFADLFKGRLYLQSKNKNIISYTEFSQKNTLPHNLQVDTINGSDICAYFYTSGTTYGRKCVVLTNENLNTAVYQQSISPINITEGDRLLNIMPLFTCYGVTLGTHLPLCLGVQVCLVPLFSAKKLKQLLMRHRPGFVITVPSHWDNFATENFDNCDLSFLKAVVVGGDKLDPEFETKVNGIFRRCNSTAWLMNGYGLTETTSTAVIPPIGTPQGSMGKEMCWTRVKVVDPITLSEMPCGEKGEICICGPTVCQGYLNDEEATAKLLKLHSDGKLWLHSGDIGYIDNSGYIYFCEREKRMYVRFDGTKVSPFAIESVIARCDAVERCMVLTAEDREHSHGKYSVAVIVPKKNSKESALQTAVRQYINKHLPEFMRPKKIVFVSKLPVTKNGKLDYFYQAENM